MWHMGRVSRGKLGILLDKKRRHLGGPVMGIVLSIWGMGGGTSLGGGSAVGLGTVRKAVFGLVGGERWKQLGGG